MAKRAVGIDIGGTGIKGALISIKSGELKSDRFKYETPGGGEPKDIATTVKVILDEINPPQGIPVGICFPSVIRHGKTLSAANVSKNWIGLNAEMLFEDTLNRHVHVLNDADAAGAAEMKFGAGRQTTGLVIMTTLGTGIGSALFYNGVLIPNAELGHIEIGGMDYEKVASFAAKEKEELSYPDWAERLQIYYTQLEKLFTPDLFIVGGGVSKHHEEFLPLLRLRTTIVAAELRNSAGIIGAGSMAYLTRKD